MATKTLLKVDRLPFCEGTRYRAHDCSGNIQANHTFYRKNDARSPKQKQYLDDAINISFVCQKAHTEFGHTKAFTKWFYQRQTGRFGKMTVDNYLAGWPGKIKTRPPE